MKSTGVEKILEELKDLLEDGEELVRSSSGDVRKKGRKVRHELTEALESAREACHQLESQVNDAVETTDRSIRKHPYRSVGIGLGIGFLLGWLMGRD